MATLEIESPAVATIRVTDECLSAELVDGRTISVPIGWYPRLVHATAEERDNWDLSGNGTHIHWPDLDEDISVEGLLAGWRSRETRESFNRWLQAKKAGRPLELYELTTRDGAEGRGSS